ncbi:DMT family transporter [Bordetella hinzii]|uniref:EamA/RhaT family transporter n=1 Tax=Bordetella hinzii TaxID=103855 RepID=A0AAN1VEF3_9BORD|nr:DMT family transporter [Bordetella hinzii]AKQ59279.1 EamA-like transporter family protein [Bordetella hinzii]AZW15475.1 EamA/RhaT family transporter [Bordetella hinzii]MBZ0076698.1 DMT family transporter [Bordetella hinzii]MBZ0079011.1 DMT family transporter [Bordetella hinzii]MBZ0086033.1 DMT family transporter [Bordetella hinzii]
MQKSSWISHGSTSLFVLLWSSGAITAKLSLLYATPFAFLLMRLGLAFAVLCLLAARRGRFLPAPGSRITTIGIGLLILGGYTVCYLLALAHGVAPGVLATVLGIQPILTLLWTERRFHGRRLAGLALALAGLVLVVWQGIHLEGLGWLGMAFALGSLLCMTAGAIMQKRSAQAPLDVMPLQYAASLVLCLLIAPSQPLDLTPGWPLLALLLWLGLVISVGATLLFYHLIQGGDLVNVTSLFYLVPAGTALLDYLLLGNPLPLLALGGMAAILGGLALVMGEPKR